MNDEFWARTELAVLQLFEELAGEGTVHAAIGPRLAELGWSEVEAEYPIAACELVFRAQGRSLAQTDCLDRVVLAELAAVLDEPADGVVLPAPSAGYAPESGDGVVKGIVVGPVRRRLAVPVQGTLGTVSVCVVDADRLDAKRIDTFDPSVHWTQVTGPLDGNLVHATGEWTRAISAAHRALASELIALATEAIRIAARHKQVGFQFGTPIGSSHASPHVLADASACLEGARALLAGSWRYGGQLSAQAAKAAAGRAHRMVSDAAQQVCGVIGLSTEYNLHRYVARGFQIDALCGSHRYLETLLGERLFDAYAEGRSLPTIICSGPADLRE